MKRFAISALLLSVLLGSCKQDHSKPITVAEPVFTKEAEGYLLKSNTNDTIAALDLEIADDEYQRQTGLMYRNKMQPHQGMLFVFPKEDYRSFYMKNTRIPLDILFLDANYTIVDFKENVAPMNEKSLPSKVPAQYVLELNANRLDAWGLDIGDRLVITK